MQDLCYGRMLEDIQELESACYNSNKGTRLIMEIYGDFKPGLFDVVCSRTFRKYTHKCGW